MKEGREHPCIVILARRAPLFDEMRQFRLAKDISCAISNYDLSRDISNLEKWNMHRHCGSHQWAAGRHRRGRFGGFGFGGRHGGGMNPDDMRAGRMLAQGDLRLVALALIAQAPRHGYEIMKLVEEKTAEWYSPSPGIVYPTLTFLEEAGYVTVS